MADIDVYTTILPNGAASHGKLTFSVFLTPSLPDSASMPPVFAHWPTSAQPLYAPGSSWFLYFNRDPTPVAGTNASPLSADLGYSLRPDLALWHALVGNRPQPLEVVARRKTNRFKDQWMLSPKSPALHDRHSTFRASYAMRQILQRNDALPAAFHLVNAAAALVTPQNIYVYPTTDKSKAATISAAFSDRDLAKAVFPRITDPVIQKRITFGQTQLEQEEGELLSGVALLALYQSCVDSLHLPTNDARVQLFSAAIEAACVSLSAVQALPRG